MKKKTASIFIIFSLLTAFCMPSLASAALNSNSPEIMDFEDKEAGTGLSNGNGWTLTLGTGTHRVEYVQDPLDPQNQVLDTYCAAAKQDTNVIYEYSSYTSGKAVFDFNYMLTRSVGNDAQFRLISSKTEKFAVDSQNGSWKYRIGGGTWVTVPDKTAAVNTWYHITIVLDPDTDEISFWLDGDPVLQNADSGIDITNINKFQIYNRCTAISNSKSVYFDNIRSRYYGTEINAEPIFNLMNSEKIIKLGETLEMDFTGRVIDTDGDSVTLTSDAGTMNGNILSYTPDSAGAKTIHVTADDGKETSVYTMTVNVIETVKLTVTGGANGTVTPSGVQEVEKGQQVTITATPDDGYAIESIQYNGMEVIGYTEGEKSYQTPALNSDSTVAITFTALKSKEEVIPFTATFNGSEGDRSFGTVFATVSLGSALEEYGILFSKTELEMDAFTQDAAGVFVGKAVAAANAKGQYGIKFTGNLEAGTYYTRAYAVYTGGKIVYGDRIVPIVIP